MCRALELLDYLARAPGPKLAVAEEERRPVTEQEALGQFSSLQAMMPGVSQIPPELREAIRWAEEQKAQRGLN